MMNKLFKNGLLALALLVMGVNFYSCDDNEGDEGQYDALYTQILKNYVDGTVIPTYKKMAEAALEMRAANEALKNNPSDEAMAAAAEAWMEARIWWEKSEAFLFGPVSDQAFNIDAHIDSWPLEIEDIKTKITEQDGDITGEEAWNEEEGVIGFHTTEYLLFDGGQARSVNDLTLAERKYLTAVTDALVWDCVLAYVSWAGKANVSSEILAVFNENEDVVDYYNDRSNYHNFGETMKSATGVYFSLEDAVQEIAEGAKTIVEEVGATKIEAPYFDKKVEEVESWYSWHSLDDYRNNILSIKNAYFGGLDDNSRPKTSLSTYIAIVDPTLDDQITDKIEECMTKIGAIGGMTLVGGTPTYTQSFYEVVKAYIDGDNSKTTAVQAASDACIELRDLFAKAMDLVQ